MEIEDISTDGQRSKSTALVERTSAAKDALPGMVLRLTPEVLGAIMNELSMCRVDALPTHTEPPEDEPRPTTPTRRRKPRDRSKKGLFLEEGDYARVTLHIYDTSWLASATGVPAFHVGVEVLGTEFSFGDMGINVNRPCEYDPDRYRDSVSLGHTDLTDQQVLRVLRELQVEWPGEAYRLNGHNCQTFAETFCQRLGLSNTIPEEYLVFAQPWKVSVTNWGAAELKRQEWPRGRPRSNKLSL